MSEVPFYLKPNSDVPESVGSSLDTYNRDISEPGWPEQYVEAFNPKSSVASINSQLAENAGVDPVDPFFVPETNYTIYILIGLGALIFLM